jgi:hypothetical protein
MALIITAQAAVSRSSATPTDVKVVALTSRESFVTRGTSAPRRCGELGVDEGPVTQDWDPFADTVHC